MDPLQSGPSTIRVEELRDLLRTRVVRLNASAFALVLGLISGVGLFIITNFLVVKGGKVVGPHLELLGQVFVGYRVTFIGSLIGLVWAGFVGWLVGYVGATVYNLVVFLRGR